MASVFFAALFALSPHAVASAAVPVTPMPSLDRQCFRLMAELSQSEDPRVSGAGLVGAQYFLGRIDAESAGFDPGADATRLPGDTGEREALVRRCGALMGAGGRDFRAIGEQLSRAEPAV